MFVNKGYQLLVEPVDICCLETCVLCVGCYVGGERHYLLGGKCVTVEHCFWGVVRLS